MTLRLCVTMQKGGVGKTTTAINLAGALANRGHDVLLVDADPQGGSTLKLGYRNHYRTADDALFDVLYEHGEKPLDQLADLAVEYAEFDLIPAHVRNFRLEKVLYSQARGVEMLRKALDKMQHEYDVVLVDSPPNLGPLSDGALIATEHVLFPSNPNTIAQDSLELLFDEIDTIEDRFTDEIDGEERKKYDIKRIGAVLNEVPSQGSVAESVEAWFHETFGEDYVFEVPELEAIEHAIEYRSSVFAYDPDDAGYPWDADKTAYLRDTYDQVAAHVEAYQ